MAKAFTKVVEVERVVVEMSKRDAAYVLAVLGCVHSHPWAWMTSPVYSAIENQLHGKPPGNMEINYSSLSQECRHWVESQPE